MDPAESYTGLLDSVEKILNLGGALTRSQWRDIYKGRARTPEALLWLAELQLNINDWDKFIKDPNSKVRWRNAQAVIQWIDDPKSTVCLVCEALSTCGLDIDEDVFRSALHKYVNVAAVNGTFSEGPK
jgi:hypothetical protein